MSRRIRAVPFDQDGTLINTFVPALRAYSIASGREITLAELEPVAHLGAARNLLTALMGRQATDSDDDIFHRALGDAVAEIEPYDGIVEVLRSLRDAGVPTAVATNSDSRSAQVVLGAHDLTAFMHPVVTVDQVAAPKPDPALVSEGIARLGVVPGECLFVGDGNGDMLAARAAGAVAVAAGWGHQAPTIDRSNIDVWAERPSDVLDLATAG